MRDISILLIDIDEVVLPFDKAKYEAQAKAVVESFGYEVVGFVYRLSTAKGIHVYVWVTPEVEPMYVPLLQYLLGSDFKRECINYFRWRRGIDLNVLFFAKKRVKRNIGIKMSCDHMCEGLKRMIALAESAGIKRVEI